jgi:epsilon-lactone hydrolase
LTLEIWPQMIHALPVWNAGLEEGRQAPESAGKFIRAQFA